MLNKHIYIYIYIYIHRPLVPRVWHTGRVVTSLSESLSHDHHLMMRILFSSIKVTNDIKYWILSYCDITNNSFGAVPSNAVFFVKVLLIVGLTFGCSSHYYYSQKYVQSIDTDQLICIFYVGFRCLVRDVVYRIRCRVGDLPCWGKVTWTIDLVCQIGMSTASEQCHAIQ